jgi:hypothetical protein
LLLLLAAVAVCPCAGVELPLRAGWNLVALPESPLDPRVEAVVASLGSDLAAIWTQRRGIWLGYAPAAPALSDLVDLNGREGYWIQVRASTVLRYLGSGSSPTSTSLQAGWNLVGANGFVQLPPDQAFAGIGPSLDSAWTQDGDWRVYRPAGGTQGAAGALAETGGTTTAYWVHVSAAAVWDRHGADVLPPGVPPATERLEVSAEFAAADPVSLSLPDGTGVTLAALGADLTVTLTRETEALAAPAAGLVPSGSLRELRIEADGPLALGVVPRLTIPRAEIGGLDPRLVWVARVADVVGERGVIADAVLYLPARYDAAGRVVVQDVFFGDTVAAAAARRGGRAGLALRIRYITLGFQGQINAERRSQLVRMLPDAKAPAARRRLTELSAAVQAEANLRPVQNVIVLVHGHNESEGAGLPQPNSLIPSTAPAPWHIDYKMDVWTYVYREFLRETDAGASVYGNLGQCTRFYEFIYPSWQSIFETLNAKLAGALAAELKVQLDLKQDFNLFVVAHSMGGLVARAGLNECGDDLGDRLQRLVTWGSPHHGAGMYSLCLLAHADPPYALDLAPDSALVTHWHYLRSKLAAVAMDTPGMRDLRWDNHLPLDLFPTTMTPLQHALAPAVYSLEDGPWLYNRNLQILNEHDRFATAGAEPNKLNAKRCVFMYGITSKQAGSFALVPPDNTKRLLYLLTESWTSMAVDELRRIRLLGTGLGATINRHIIANPTTAYLGQTLADSDGAVPITSMTGAGLDVIPHYLGDVDHEEYYGAPLPIDEAGNREVRAEGAAQDTATATFSRLALLDPIYACPEVRIESPAADAPRPATAATSWTFPLRGRLVWPGDAKPGLRLKAKGVKAGDVCVEARLLFAAWPKYPSWASRTPEQMGVVEVGRNWYTTRWLGREETSKQIGAASDGSFQGSFTVPAYQADFAAGIEVRALLKDGTRVDGYSLFPGIVLPYATVTPGCTITLRETAGLSRLLRCNDSSGDGSGASGGGFQADFPEPGGLISMAFTIKPGPEWVGRNLRVYWQQFAGGMELVLDRLVTADDVKDRAPGFALNREAVFPGYEIAATGDFNPDGTPIYEALDRFALMVNNGSTVTISPAYRPETAMPSGSGREGP